jgi:large subunit ribosomal protein L21
VYAVIQTGGKQYRVSPGELIKIEKMPGAIGDEVRFEAVLFVGENAGSITNSISEGVTVRGTIVDQNRNDKIIVFKFKRRKMYRRKSGHRQEMTAVRIEEIISAKSKVESPKEVVASKESKPTVAKKQAKAKKQSADTKQKSGKAETPDSKGKKKVSTKPASPKKTTKTKPSKGASPSTKKTTKKVSSKKPVQDKE